MDGTVRIWDINTGECRHTLVGHTSLVGLLRLSPSFLVSAAADATSRIWNPNTGKLYPTLDSVNGAITCLYVDDYKIISGSDGVLKLWSAQTGYHVRDLLRDTGGFWEVAFKGRWCVAVSNTNDSTILNIWDFETDEEEEEEEEEEDSNEGYQPGEFDDPL
jgi:F-box and WD-40 domain protein CDC4